MASDNIFGYVQARERSKSGKSWRLQVGGKWYTVSNRANLDGIQQGVYVECRMGGFPADNGSWISTIEGIRPAQAPQGGYPPNPHQGGQNAANAPPGAPSRLASAHWDDSALRFLSNVVGSAITAGVIKDPVEVLAWTQAAEESLRSLGQAQTPGRGGSDIPGSASGEEPPPYDDSDVPW